MLLTKQSKSAKPQKHRLISQIAIILVLVLVISVYFTMLASAQNTYTITDGDQIKVHSSTSTDIDQVLAEAGIAVGQNDRITTETNGNATQILIQRTQAVTLNYGGQEISAETYGSTVEQLLNDLSLSVSEDDVIASNGRSLSLNDNLYDGMNIDITKNTDETITKTVAVPFESVTYLDPTLEKGTKTIKTAGSEGQQEITYLEEYVNGELVNTTTLHTKLISAPVTEVILVGSGERLAAEGESVVTVATPEPEETQTEENTTTASDISEPENSSDTSYEEEPAYEETTPLEYEEPEPEAPEYDEPAYEEPEYEEPEYEEPVDSGNTITTSSGEVLSYVDVLNVEATAYCGGGTTATGTPARYGAIAVDPDVIPYGTKMYIESNDGKWIYGVATAEDCGGAINGYIIDLYFDDYNTCIQFGRRDCTVYILEWG